LQEEVNVHFPRLLTPIVPATAAASATIRAIQLANKYLHSCGLSPMDLSAVTLSGKVPAPSSDEMRNLLLDLYPQMKLSFGKAKVAFALGKSGFVSLLFSLVLFSLVCDACSP
jgi:hypothetical protein